VALFWDRTLEATLETFNDISNHFISKEIIDSFQNSPISTAMKMLHKSETEFRNGWEELIHRLLTFMPNLHKSFGGLRYTVLHQILDLAEPSFESQEMGNEWLAILEDFGVDIITYLRTEHLHQLERGSASMLLSFFDSYIASRYTIFSENSPRISWDWYIDLEGHASKALHLFRNLGPVRHNLRKDHQSPDEMFNWPYFYSRLDRWYSALGLYTGTEEESSTR
jgi:hypothetical protein